MGLISSGNDGRPIRSISGVRSVSSRACSSSATILETVAFVRPVLFAILARGRGVGELRIVCSTNDVFCFRNVPGLEAFNFFLSLHEQILFYVFVDGKYLVGQVRGKFTLFQLLNRG